ncbi:hypothetical protein AGMMS49960_02990 [Betaproteobacteria bacterium]|nr:hypothetical protein AGMMS49543_01910 [Betaproteobacteria bacterium]GHT98927.1 hypothetical protein AGMMS49960_02990 [Betaproteobacteria bacterium]GHU19633.1 hypothetical protein AGMMS50243_12110 [Betaproteobacteria bacterium]
MQKLTQSVAKYQAKTSPVPESEINNAEEKIGFPFSEEYRRFLSTFGRISFLSHETYGLGVPDDYYLNIRHEFQDLSQDAHYPANAVPVLELGDGHYYLYDNIGKRVLLWASPNGGVVKELHESLEDFLIQKIFPR